MSAARSDAVSVHRGEIFDKTRLLRRRGALPPSVMHEIERALLIAFDLAPNR